MRECIEAGILQSYVDDELSPAAARSVTAHVATCRVCAVALDEARAETALFASAFAAEMALEVPTARLRERLDAAIAESERPARSSDRRQSEGWWAWLTSLAESFKVSPQQALGLASLIVLIAVAAIFAAIKLRPAGQIESAEAELADRRNAAAGAAQLARATPSPTPANGESDNALPRGKAPVEAPGRNNRPRKPARPVLVPEPSQLPQGELAASKPLPGEQSYLKAIDALSAEIQASGEANMRPSLRAEYERNLAVVDQAIDSTRRLARRHPNDPDAVQFLYSSYQSKVDLLSAVAQQARPVVATR